MHGERVLFAYSNWMTTKIDEIIKETKREKNKKRKRYLTGQGSNLKKASSDDAIIAVAELDASANTDEAEE